MEQAKYWYDGIIGYENKKELFSMYIDAFNNYDKYKKANAYFPSFILLNGDPGLGKTLFANKIFDALKGNHYTILHNEKDIYLIKKINTCFNKAIEDGVNGKPSIVFLDDLDKFFESNSRSPNVDFGIIQTKLDEIVKKKAKVFVIATSNNLDLLPYSLTRSGRFRSIEFSYPKKSSSDAIIAHYLEGKNLNKDVDITMIQELLYENSCSDLEAVIQKASALALYRGEKAIHNIDFIKAYLSELRGIDSYIKPEINQSNIETAYHEASHAFISSYYDPKSVVLVALTPNTTIHGFTARRSDCEDNQTIAKAYNNIKVLLAGHAITSLKFNKIDNGCYNDLNKAFNKLEDLSKFAYLNNFDDISNFSIEDIDDFNLKLHKKSAIILQNLDTEVREILNKNMPIIDKLATKLLNEQFLYQKDLEEAVKVAIR